MITAIIVEDEISLRKLVRKLINDIDDTIMVLEECKDISTAIAAINNHNPDIIFLDIVLPRGTSLDMLEMLPDLKSEVIFVTAYDNYILKAFDYAAVGYVLKPIDKNKLRIAIENAKKRIAEKQHNNIDVLLSYIKDNSSLDKIGIPTQDGMTFVNCNEIIRCEGCNSYTKIFLTDNTSILSSYNLSKFECILPAKAFCKVHKSHIVALAHVKKYHAKDSMIEIGNSEDIPISKTQKNKFMLMFKTPRH